MKALRGVIAATVIPHLPDECAPAGLRVAVDRYEEHCGWLVRSGCSGVAVNSSTGESGSLTVHERRMITRAAVRAVGSSAERANHAAEDGADAVTCLPPLGCAPTFSEVMRHFEAVAEVGLALVVCNDPWICQVDI